MDVVEETLDGWEKDQFGYLTNMGLSINDRVFCGWDSRTDVQAQSITRETHRDYKIQSVVLHISWIHPGIGIIFACSVIT